MHDFKIFLSFTQKVLHLLEIVSAFFFFLKTSYLAILTKETFNLHDG